jgi:hypothetical protein
MAHRNVLRGIALAAALVAVPAVAYAAVPGGSADRACVGHGGFDEAAFPMTKAAFMEKVEAKATKIRAKVSERVAESKLPEATRKQVMADVETGITRVRAAAEKAAADGKVTRDEAMGVKTLAKEIKREIKTKYGFSGKDRKGKRGDKA